MPMGSAATGTVPARSRTRGTRDRRAADFPGGFMKGLGQLIVAAGTAALLTGCMHQGTSTRATSSGDVAIDSLSATRTAILRVQNDYPAEVRVYTVIGGQENYVAKAMPGEIHTVLLDPNLFPNSAISFTTKPADGSAPKTLGPYKIERGQTVELVVPANLAAASTNIHRSAP
jgi:hypothetical protein